MNLTISSVFDAFIVSKLAPADPANVWDDRIWSEKAPADTGWPFVLVTQATPPDDWLALGGDPIDASTEVIARVVMRADDWGPLLSPAALITSRLHKQSGAAPGGGVVAECVRVGEFRLIVQGPDQPEERHLGARFRMTAA